MDNQLFEIIMDRMDRIEKKVDKLVEFKWQIIGGGIVVSAIITVGFQILNLILKH